MAAPRNEPATTSTGKLKAFFRTQRGLAVLIAVALCAVTAILAIFFILPELNVMGALGVLTIYIIIFIFFDALARMVLGRVCKT
jgi:hypothetical protein